MYSRQMKVQTKKARQAIRNRKDKTVGCGDMKCKWHSRGKGRTVSNSRPAWFLRGGEVFEQITMTKDTQQ